MKARRGLSPRPLTLFLIFLLASLGASAGELTSKSLEITGASLDVVTTTVSTSPGLPSSIQTAFGSKQNEEAPFIEGLTAVGELIGPGLNQPLRLETTPGWSFQIPGLREQGNYTLQNVRLMKGESFLQQAVPAAAYIVLNPVRCGAVKYAGDWKWSNYRATAGLAKAPHWLETDWTLAKFDPWDRGRAREDYRRSWPKRAVRSTNLGNH